MKHRGVIIAPMICILLAGIAFSRIQLVRKPVSDASRVVRLTAAYRELIRRPATGLGVKEPITVLTSDTLLDGGTVLITFRDANGIEFITARLSLDNNPIRNCLYFQFGATNRALHGTRCTLKYGADRDRTICGILLRWAAQDPEFIKLLAMGRDDLSLWRSEVFLRRLGNEEFNRQHAMLVTYHLLASCARVRSHLD